MLWSILFIILWAIIGIASGLYWWTREFDFTSNEIDLLFSWAFCGPLYILLGYIIHNNPYKIFLKRKNKK